MKTYLQRLAARAEGVGSTPSLIPSGRNEPISQTDTASAFAEGEAVVEPPAIKKSPRNAAPSIESPEPAQPVPLLPSRRRARQTPLHDDRVETKNEKGSVERISLRPNTPDTVLATPPAVLSNTKSNEPSADESFASTKLTGSLLVPRDLNPDPNPITTAKTKTSDEHDDQNTPVVASVEPVAPLEPRLKETLPPPAHVRGEPRLVIGQIRVDVVATAPPKTHEVVRIVSRRDGSNNGSRVASSIAKLRFGLGQM